MKKLQFVLLSFLCSLTISFAVGNVLASMRSLCSDLRQFIAIGLVVFTVLGLLLLGMWFFAGRAKDKEQKSKSWATAVFIAGAVLIALSVVLLVIYAVTPFILSYLITNQFTGSADLCTPQYSGDVLIPTENDSYSRNL